MRISKRRIKRIVLEEQYKLLREQWGGNKEALSPLVSFGQAWAGLGGAVSEQILDLVNAHIEGRIEDAVYEMNPNALDVAVDRLGNVLNIMERDGSEDASDMLLALETAQEIFAQGDAEVEADARAAGDRP